MDIRGLPLKSIDLAWAFMGVPRDLVDLLPRGFHIGLSWASMYDPWTSIALMHRPSVSYGPPVDLHDFLEISSCASIGLSWSLIILQRGCIDLRHAPPKNTRRLRGLAPARPRVTHGLAWVSHWSLMGFVWIPDQCTMGRSWVAHEESRRETHGF